jgi:membrane protein implicated in regulation of membrane protease activity
MSIKSNIDTAAAYANAPRGIQFLGLLIIIVIVLIVAIGGGGLVYTFLNTLILEPIKGGKISAFALIVLGVFVVMIVNRFRHREEGEVASAQARERLRFETQQRRRY